MLYIKQKPQVFATIDKKPHVDMMISVDMKTIQSSGIKKNTLYNMKKNNKYSAELQREPLTA